MGSEIMKHLKFDPDSGLYSIIEAGIKYEFPVSLHDDFKRYIFRYDFVSRWYRHLQENELVSVRRTSAYE